MSSRGKGSGRFAPNQSPQALQLSGRKYVVVRSNSEPDAPFAAIKTPERHNCVHGITMCEECVESWAIDYHVYFDRTQGGFILAEKLRQFNEGWYNRLVNDPANIWRKKVNSGE